MRNVFDMKDIGSALPDGGQGNSRQPQEQDHRPTRATGGNTADHVADRGVSPQNNVCSHLHQFFKNFIVSSLPSISTN